MAVFWFNPTFLSSLPISLVQSKPSLTNYKIAELLEASPVTLVHKTFPWPPAHGNSCDELHFVSLSDFYILFHIYASLHDFVIVFQTFYEKSQHSANLEDLHNQHLYTHNLESTVDMSHTAVSCICPFQLSCVVKLYLSFPVCFSQKADPYCNPHAVLLHCYFYFILFCVITHHLGSRTM